MLTAPKAIVENESAGTRSSHANAEASRCFCALDRGACKIRDGVPGNRYRELPYRLLVQTFCFHAGRRVRTVSAQSIHLDVGECALSVGACHRKPFDNINLFGSVLTKTSRAGLERRGQVRD